MKIIVINFTFNYFTSDYHIFWGWTNKLSTNGGSPQFNLEPCATPSVNLVTFFGFPNQQWSYFSFSTTNAIGQCFIYDFNQSIDSIDRSIYIYIWKCLKKVLVSRRETFWRETRTFSSIFKYIYRLHIRVSYHFQICHTYMYVFKITIDCCLRNFEDMLRIRGQFYPKYTYNNEGWCRMRQRSLHRFKRS